ncbi:uncharacterized protein LOC130767563 [Actinidia eriantha]|uniref:uncharacterized protein LOC130767563 n=1 Tax=Actinidia eriantha TaxID=165200 RepID=UPI00258C001D|nr:uncharacterized protein LOC130767563 [Actinidia eriantha]
MDVKHGEIDQSIYIHGATKGVEIQSHPNNVCKLKKALYASTESQVQKDRRVSRPEQILSSTCRLKPICEVPRGKLAIVLVYVDDLISSRDEFEIQRTRENLSRLKDAKKAYSLPEKVRERSVEEMCNASMQAHFCSMAANAKLCSKVEKELKDVTMNRQLVGNLIYLTLTQPSKPIYSKSEEASLGNSTPNIEDMYSALVSAQSLGAAKDNL